MPTNAAAWLKEHDTQLEVGPAPYTPPKEGELVVRNHAIAINPVDWITQSLGKQFFGWLKPPFVLGSDLAGEVVEVGPGVTRFKVGDRVVAHATGQDKSRSSAAEGSFQLFTVVLAHMTAPIPDSMPFENAAVLPLATSTAACGLFQKDQLGLQPPSSPRQANGETLLVWGGSTSVGSSAIQLAVAAGYEVITTASPRNFEYVRRLGASWVFDYGSPTAVADIIRAFEGKRSAGALAIGKGSTARCLDVVHAVKGRKFVSLASTPVSLEEVTGPRKMRRMMALMPRMVGGMMSAAITSRVRGIRTKMIYGSTLMDNEVGPLIYEQFLPAALATGQFVPAPEPHVIGKGLEHVQAGFDAQRKGVSAKKVVVAL